MQRTSLLTTDTSGGKGVRRLKTKLCALSLALVIPAITYAAKPSATTDVGCAVLAPAQIYEGQQFTAKVVRVPSYPGGWSQPTITVYVTYPTTDGEAMRSSEQMIWKHNVTYALAPFTPYPDLQLDVSGTASAKIEAKVSEPLRKGKERITLCTPATATLLP